MTVAADRTARLKSNEAIILLLAHLVCADEQIHRRELTVLKTIAEQTEVSDDLENAIEKIFRDKPDKPRLDDLVDGVSKDDRLEALRLLLTVALADDHYCEDERAFIGALQEAWNVSPGKMIELRNGATSINNQMLEADGGGDEGGKDDPSLGARVVGVLDSQLPTFTKAGLALAPESARQKVDRLRQELLLAGPEYDEAIELCREISQRDFEDAEVALDDTMIRLAEVENEVISRLEELDTGGGKSATEVREQLAAVQEAVGESLVQKIQRLQASLRRKRRAIDSFTIAFMGKTKVGKSTLHAVVTGEGWDGIGQGAQRTTRYNRVYEWKNIRIIDTPGIGAPEGKSDEEIARTVVDEADVICYIVTDDSQQESEFEFLEELKKRNKPLIILLNVKKNLEHPKRLKRFLKRPDRVFKMKGRNSLEGHIDRIRRYASSHYDNDYFDIIPVQLLAAQLSRQRDDEDYAEELYEASRLPKFLDSLRVSLVEEGEVRRSQTFVGSASYDLEEVSQSLREQAKSLTLLAAKLEDSRSKLMKDVRQATADARADGIAIIEQEYQKAKSAIPTFANNHWEIESDEELQKAWNQKLKSLKVEKSIKNGLQEVCERYEARVENALEEVQRDIELGFDLNPLNFGVSGTESEKIFRRVFKMGGSVVAAAGGIAMAVVGAVPLAVGAIVGGVFAAIFGSLFKSKAQQQQEATKKICEELRPEIVDAEEKTKDTFTNNFDEQSQSLSEHLENYFDRLTTELRELGEKLEDAFEDVESARETLNRRYASRIINWACEEPSDQDWDVTSVYRESGKEMRIAVDEKPPLEVDPTKISKILQEDIEIVVQSH